MPVAPLQLALDYPPGIEPIRGCRPSRQATLGGSASISGLIRPEGEIPSPPRPSLGVAAAAGVGKPTVYRRYPRKRELVIAAVTSLAAALPDAPSTSDVRADLLSYLAPAFGVFQSRVGFAMLGALLVKERDDPALMELFRANIVRPRMRVVSEILRRAI